MKNILLIGGAGYIGTVIAEYLIKKNYKVKIIDNFIYNNSNLLNDFFKKFPQINLVNKDICNIDNYKPILEGIDALVFLAGLVGDPITKAYPELSMRINRDATKNLIDSISQSEVKKFIFISTCSNYGLINDDEIANEEHILNPISLYAKLKTEIEYYLINDSKKNFSSTILRFATAFGLSYRMRFDLTINEFIYEMIFNKKISIYDPDTWRPYCHVNDFARLIELVIKSNNSLVDRQVFNVGSDKNNFTKRQVVNLILKYITDCKIEYKQAGSDPRNYRVDFSKVNKILNFKTIYNLEDCLPELIFKIRDTVFLEKSNYGNYFIK